MDRNKNYSLGLYEKAIPTGFTFEEMLAITDKCGFDRLEVSIDETDMRLSRLDWSAAEQKVRMFTGEFWYQKGQDYLEEISRSSAFLRGKLDKAFAG